MDIAVLEKLGLEEKEIKIYLALLKLGSITATTISKETRIERTLCYSIIERLIDKGLVSYVNKKNVRYFHAASPNKLKEDLIEKQRELDLLMPQLLGLQKLSKEETKVELYKGKDGLMTVLKHLMEGEYEYKVLGAAAIFEEVFPSILYSGIKSFEEKKIKGFILLHPEEIEKTTPQKYEEWRVIPDNIQIPTSLLLYSDKVVQFIWQEPYFAIVMDNKKIYESYNQYFDWLWKSAKVVKKSGE